MSVSQRWAGGIAGRAIGRPRALLVASVAAVALAVPGAALAAPPQVDYTLSGPAGANAWFTGPVTIKWTITGTITSPVDCGAQTLTADTAGTQLLCTASNDDGTTTTTTKAIKIDQTPPSVVAATPARGPDDAPWYVAPVAVAWAGTDATSGIATCTALTYAGPDGPSVAPAGTCRDNAGNVSAPVPFDLAFDTTAPALTGLTAVVAGTGATLRWTAGPDVQRVTIVRRPGDLGAAARTLADGAPGTTTQVTDGPLAPGVPYTWTVTVRDAAGNATSATATATVPAVSAAGTPVKTKSTKKTAKLPTLRWRARPGAKYYNLQLFRNGHKILSAWPTQPHYTLHALWHYRGHRHRLIAGHYRWYAWAGYGARSRHRYGATPIRGSVKIP